MNLEKRIGRQFLLATAGISLLLQGCATVQMEAINVGVPVLMNAKEIPLPASVRHFSIHQEEQFVFLHRLYGGAKPDVNAMLQRQLQMTPGDAIVNVSIRGTTDYWDIVMPVLIGVVGAFIVPPLTLIAYEPFFFDLKSYTVEGDIITYKKEPAIAPVIPLPKIDPMTGLPVEKKNQVEYNPETGLPK